MKKSYALYISFLVLTILPLFTTSQTFAVQNCSPLYNGGVTNQQYCFNPTPTPENAKNVQTNRTTQVTATPAPQQTQGGKRIYPVAKSKTTPSTGPEEWSLPALFLIGTLGFILRNKAKT